jgi:pimeloyl-ACP methyl ester carboxylesterase
MRIVLLFLICLNLGDINAQSIEVPVDYANPDSGIFNLEYEFGADYDPSKPTVIVIADAQQFYVSKGRVQKIQEELFGEDFNVLGIITRGNNQELRDKVKVDDSETDWDKAYSIFQSFQYVNDIQSVINKLLKDQEIIYLYGQSGGAFLITEYLSVFPDSKVKKVFIGAVVNPSVEAQLGLNHDNFQREFLAENKLAQTQLYQILEESYFSRELVAHLFQRQNFFVEKSMLNLARTELMEKLYLKDTASVNKYIKDYQIDALRNFLVSDYGIPIRVRLAEFIYPINERLNSGERKFYPDLENSYHTAFPVLNKKNGTFREIQIPFNPEKLRKFNGEVFILSARYDHVADYRSSIYLSGVLKNCELFVVDDDHTFKRLKSNGDYAGIIQGFLKQNSGTVISHYEKYQWFEK